MATHHKGQKLISVHKGYASAPELQVDRVCNSAGCCRAKICPDWWQHKGTHLQHHDDVPWNQTEDMTSGINTIRETWSLNRWTMLRTRSNRTGWCEGYSMQPKEAEQTSSHEGAEFNSQTVCRVHWSYLECFSGSWESPQPAAACLSNNTYSISRGHCCHTQAGRQTKT